MDVGGSWHCPKGKARAAAQTICEDMKKKIKDEGKSELYPVECPDGETCVNKKPIKTFQPVDQVFTFSGPLGCKITVKITGSFTGTGDIGECCPKKGKCP